MKKKVYSAFVLGMLLLWAACSEKGTSPISGSTEDPNMITADTSSYVQCRLSLAKRSSDAEQEECVWFGEMWNRESGYRVHTGFDNGTNTSGIWTWSLDGADGRGVQLDWPETVSADFDSMALAEVIDGCAGSICGTVTFEDMKLIYPRREYWPLSRFTLEFSFGGKDSSGNFEIVDAREMQGLCIEYIGKGLEMELVVGEDSLEGWRESWTKAVVLPDYEVAEPRANQKGNELCFPWSSFVKYAPRVREIIPYLQGIRITINTERTASFSTYFDIIGLGEFTGHEKDVDKSRPVKGSCEVTSVKEYFCDCSYSEERSEYEGKVKARSYFEGLLRRTAWDTTVLKPLAAEDCLNDFYYRMRFEDTIVSVASWERPCDNPLPKTYICAEGSESESVEFAEMYAEYEKMLQTDFEKEKRIVDSIVVQCLSLRDTLGNGELIPDTCRFEEDLWRRSIAYLNYVEDAAREATAEFFDRMDSIASLDSLDEPTRMCVDEFREDNPYGDEFLTRNGFTFEQGEDQALVKSMRCQSGKVYYTDEYKEFLQELGIEDDTDSLQVYAAAKKVYRYKGEIALENCKKMIVGRCEGNCDE